MPTPFRKYIRDLRKLKAKRDLPSPAGDVKAPVKVTVTARKIRADGTLGEEVEIKNIEVTRG